MSTPQHPEPDRYRGQGMVFLRVGGNEDPVISGYWGLEPDGSPTLLEWAPEWPSSRLSAAVEWAME